ncbi:MAG: ABC transporter permease [Flavobacteriaceae bacterium]
MKRLLSIEFDKLKYHKGSRIIIVAYFALLAAIALIAAIKFDIGPVQFHLAEQGIFNFPYIWHFNSFVAAFLKFFLLLVIVSMTANEYSFKTLKQNLIDGLSKKEFILSKFYMVVVFAAISTLFVFIISLILGLIFSDYNEIGIIFSDLGYLFVYFLKLVAFFTFGLFLGLLIKKSAYAVGAMLIWFFVETYAYFQITRSVEGELGEFLVGLFPLQSMWRLIPEPFTRLNAVQSVAKQVGEQLELDYSISFISIVVSILWVIIFLLLSLKLLQSRDL